MATSPQAIASDQGWQDYTPPKPKKASQDSEGWEDYTPNVAAPKFQGAPGPTPGLQPRAKAMVSSGEVPQPSPTTDFEAKRGPKQQKGFLGGLKDALLSGPAKAAKDIDTIYGVSQEGKAPPPTPDPFDVGDTARKEAGYNLPYRIGAGYLQGAGLADPSAMEERAAHGDVGGVAGSMVGQMAPWAIEPAAKATKGIREGVGDYIRNPETGELRKNPTTIAATAGAIGGGLTTAAMYKNPWYGGVAGYHLGPSLMEAMFPESEAQGGARRGKAVAAETESKMKTIEDARLKELADQERLKEQDAQSRMRRGKEQERIDKLAAGDQPPAPLFPGASSTPFGAAAGPSPVGAAPVGLPPIPEGNPTPFPTVKTRGQVAAETKAAQPKILSPEQAAETPRTGNEGRGATWQNGELYRMVQDSTVPYEDKRLAVAQLSLRRLPLPENARYLMGDPNASRAVLNPKETTRFTPLGEPIRDMTNPQMASRSPIWTPESPSPAPGTPPYDPGRIIRESYAPSTGVGAPQPVGSKIGKEAPAAPAAPTQKLVAPNARTPVKPMLKDIGLELTGEYPPGNYSFRDNQTGGTVTVPKEGFNEAKLRDQVTKQRQASRTTQASERPPETAQGVNKRVNEADAKQVATAENASMQRSGVEEGSRTKPTEELAREEAAAVKPGRVQEELSPEELANAEGRLREEVGMMSSMDRPGVYFDEWGENAPTASGRSGMGGSKKGVRAGGSWRGVQSGRGMMPFMSEHPEFTPSAIEKALEKDSDNPTYQKVMRAAAEFNRSRGTGTTLGAEPIGKPENYEDDERAAMREENWGEATEPESQTIGDRIGKNTKEREKAIASGEDIVPGTAKGLKAHAESVKVEGAPETNRRVTEGVSPTGEERRKFVQETSQRIGQMASENRMRPGESPEDYARRQVDEMKGLGEAPGQSPVFDSVREDLEARKAADKTPPPVDLQMNAGYADKKLLNKLNEALRQNPSALEQVGNDPDRFRIRDPEKGEGATNGGRVLEVHHYPGTNHLEILGDDEYGWGSTMSRASVTRSLKKAIAIVLKKTP